LYTKIYFKVNSNAASRLATWRRHANELVMLFYTTTGRRRRVFFVTGCSSCARCTGQGNDWVDSMGTNGKPTFRRRPNRSWVSAICNHFADIAA